MVYGVIPAILLHSSTARLFCGFPLSRDASQINPRLDRLARAGEQADEAGGGVDGGRNIQRSSSCFAKCCERLVLLVQKILN